MNAALAIAAAARSTPAELFVSGLVKFSVPPRASMVPLLVTALPTVPTPWRTLLLVIGPPLSVAPKPVRTIRPPLVIGRVMLSEPPVDWMVPVLATGARIVPGPEIEPEELLRAAVPEIRPPPS